MFDYTKMTIDQTVTDVKRIFHSYKIGAQLVYIAYLVYALIAKTGIWYANFALLALSVAYFVFFLSTTDYGKTPDGKQLKKNVHTTYIWSKRFIRLFTLGIAVYDIVTTPSTNAVSVLLTAFMVIGWAIEILFDVIIRVITARISLVKEAIDADVETLLKPVKSVGNFFKKAIGQAPTPTPEPTKQRKWLDEKMTARKEKQREQKQRLAQEKAQRKAEEKRLREQEKARKKHKKLSNEHSTNDETDGAGTQ